MRIQEKRAYNYYFWQFVRKGNLEMASELEGQVIGCHSVQQWKDQFQKGLDSKKLVVVDFTASWCGPCRFISPILAEIAKKTPHVLFLKVDVDELQAVAKDFQVEAMPTFLFFKEGKEVDRLVGARKEELQAKINKHESTQLEGVSHQD